MTIIPSRKPRLYGLPSLCTSYICTFGLTNEITSVTIEIIPCHRPSRMPAPELFMLGFGPGAPIWMLAAGNSTVLPGGGVAPGTGVLIWTIGPEAHPPSMAAHM